MTSSFYVISSPSYIDILSFDAISPIQLIKSR